jgi:hypothetical protein
MVYSTEAVRWRARDVRAGFLGSARAAVAGPRLAGGASGSAAYEGRSREQAPVAAAHPPGGNPPRAPPTDPSCPCRSTGAGNNAGPMGEIGPAISDHYLSANDRDVTMLATA